MMGRQRADQAQFFYSFHLEERIPASHLLRKINVFVSKALADVHREMAAFYSLTFRATAVPNRNGGGHVSRHWINPASVNRFCWNLAILSKVVLASCLPVIARSN